VSHLIQIFLPFNVGDARQMIEIEAVESELLDRFGGVNINSPAKGLWDSGAGVERDKIIVVEIMTEELDLGCWHNYRQQLERTFDQDEILIRAAQVSQL